MVKLEDDQINDMAERICASSQVSLFHSMRVRITDLQIYCESPIEIALGAAFHFVCSCIAGARARATLVYLNETDRSRERLLKQWELVPQFKWENYRIDFALFADLAYPIFIECDGHDFHERTKQQAAHDRGKDRAIQAAGIPILRFTGSQIHSDAIQCALEIFLFAQRRLAQEAKKTA